jgi:hypothetical protein
LYGAFRQAESAGNNLWHAIIKSRQANDSPAIFSAKAELWQIKVF